MVLVKEETRKGPWTEEEDMQLVCFVGLFGERRWDFIAKVSGLHRTGKSCRLRWVNYLHPGLKRGRMTPQEERLVLELHARWGNRWSRIARKLPGRTDNEIKNYWRTHMRKKAQERKRASSSPASAASAGFPTSSSSNSLSSSSSSSSSSLTGSYTVTSVSPEPTHTGVPQFYDTSTGAAAALKDEVIDEEGVKGYPMEQIWEEIASSEEYSCAPPPPSLPTASPALWDYAPDPLWKIGIEEEEEQLRSFFPVGTEFLGPGQQFGVCNDC